MTARIVLLALLLLAGPAQAGLITWAGLSFSSVTPSSSFFTLDEDAASFVSFYGWSSGTASFVINEPVYAEIEIIGDGATGIWNESSGDPVFRAAPDPYGPLPSPDGPSIGIPGFWDKIELGNLNFPHYELAMGGFTNEAEIHFRVTPVSEPRAWAAFAAGLLVVGYALRGARV